MKLIDGFYSQKRRRIILISRIAVQAMVVLEKSIQRIKRGFIKQTEERGRGLLDKEL